MNTATTPRDLIVEVIAEADNHLHTVDHYEKQADAVLTIVGSEVESLQEQVEQQHEINAGWVAYGERVKATRRKYADDLAAAIGYDQQRWLPIEAMITLAAERFQGERLKRESTSGLLRGMARRVHAWRQTSAQHYAAFWDEHAENQRLATELARVQDELVTQNRLYRKVGAERDEKQFEIERLRRLLARREDGKPNPWFTKPAEFPIEQHEQADRESPFVPGLVDALSQVRDRQIEHNSNEQIVGALSLSSLDHLRKQFEKLLSRYDAHTLLAGEWPEAEPITAGELDEALTLDADTERTDRAEDFARYALTDRAEEGP